MTAHYGFKRRLYVDAEGAFGQGPGTGSTQGVFAATDAIRYITAEPPPVQKRMTERRADRTATRSMALALVNHRFDPVDFSIERSIANSGTNTTPPDTTALMTNAFGTETVGGSDVTYSIAAGPTDSVAMMIADDAAKLVHIMYGGAVTMYRQTIPDGGTPTEGFDLQFAQHSIIAEDAITFTDGSTTTGTVANPNRWVNPFGIVIVTESEHILTSTDPADWDSSTGVFTNVTRAHNSTVGAAHSATTANALVPSSATTAGSPVGDHQVTASYHSTTVVVKTGSMEFTTGRRLRALERGNDFSVDIEAHPLEVTATLSGILDQGADTEILGATTNNDTGTFILNIGDVSGSKYVSTLAVCQLMDTRVVDPGNDDILQVEVSAFAYGSSGNDDVSVVTS